jgi:hypothetical protein
MPSCTARNFDGVTPAIFDCLVAKAADQGINISADSGNARKSGFEFAWNYNRTQQTLMIKCTDRPIIIGCGTINGKIDEVVNGCRVG